MSTFQRAIPGQSLTDEPKNYPWERPPEETDPNEAVLYHLDRVTDPEVIDNVFQAFDIGLPVKVLTDSMLTAAVGKGIHSVDLGLLVEPVIRKAVMKIADQAGVEYKEDFEDKQTTPEEQAALIVQAAKRTPEKEKDAGYQFLMDVGEGSKPQEEPDPEAEEMEEQQPEMAEGEMTEEQPKGLMAR